MNRLLWAGLVAVALCAQARAGSFDDFKQGVIALRHGDRNGAIAALSRALSAGDLPANLRPVALFDRAFAHAANRQIAPAISDLTDAIKLKPDDIAAIALRARMYAASGDSRAAAADCHKVVALNAKNPSILSICGYFQWKIGDFDQAVSCFESAIRLQGARPSGLDVLWLELVRLRAGKPNQAEFSRLTGELKLKGWPAPIFDLYMDRSSPEAVEAAAGKDQFAGTKNAAQNDRNGSAASTNNLETVRRQCGMTFFVGEWRLLHRDYAGARIMLTKSIDICPKTFVDSDAAAVELKRIAGNQK